MSAFFALQKRNTQAVFGGQLLKPIEEFRLLPSAVEQDGVGQREEPAARPDLGDQMPAVNFCTASLFCGMVLPRPSS